MDKQRGGMVMDRNLRYFLTAAVIVAMTIGAAGPAWAKKRPAPPTTPPPRATKLSKEEKQILRQFKRGHRLERLSFVKESIREGKDHLRSLDAGNQKQYKRSMKAYRLGIRDAKKQGDAVTAKALKRERKDYKSEVQATRAYIGYHKALKRDVDGKGARNYSAPEGGEWKEVAAPAPKAKRVLLKALNKDTRARIKERKVLIKEAKQSGDAVSAAALRFENKKDRQEINRVGRPALMRASGYRYVVKEESGGFFDTFLDAHNPRNQAEGIAEGHKFGQ